MLARGSEQLARFELRANSTMAKRKAPGSDSCTDKAFELVSLGRASYASKSAIASLLQHVDQHGVPETYDRFAQYKARKEVCRKRQGEYGPLVIDKPLTLGSGKLQTIPMQNAFAFLKHNCRESPHYAAIVQAALRRHPCTPAQPWRLILYQDGVDPSDMGAKHHSRKSAVMYWSFVELGMLALSQEEVWGTVVVSRYSEYTQLPGKGGSIFEAVLEHFFGGTHDIRRSGCSVTFPDGEHALLLAKASVLLADLPALKECIDCKGHSGALCCPLCVNAVQENTSAEVALHELTNSAVSIATTELSAFTKQTDKSIKKTVRKINSYHEQMVQGRITADEYDIRSSMLGWNHTVCNIILNDRFGLGLSKMIMYDWAHIYVHDGLGDVELGKLMKVLRKTPSTYEELGDYVSRFSRPKNAVELKHLFTKTAIKNNYKNESFTCTGSEFLTLTPILLRYLKNVVLPRGEYKEHVQSMISCLEVIVMLQAVKTNTVSPGELARAISKHLKQFKACYGASACRPKHHYALHLPDMLAHHGFLLATFTHERKHRLVTRYTRDRRNLRSFDSGTTEEITCHQVWELAQPFYKVCSSAQARGPILIALKELFPGVTRENLSILNNMLGNGGTISAGDVCSCLVDGRAQVGELMIAVGVRSPNGEHKAYIVMSLWQPDPSCSSDEWRRFKVSRENCVVLPLECLDTVFTYMMSADKSACVIFVPFELRRKR